MTGNVTTTSGTATRQMTDLLEARGVAWEGSKAGYVDVLGEEAPEGPISGQVFRSRMLPPIYEGIWRPLVARALFGRGFKADAELRMAMDMLAVSAGDKVLDVGCGTGNYARHLAEAAGDDGLVVGMDSSPAMLAAAVKRGGGPNLAYLLGDAMSLPFEDGQFDAVCCIGVIHSLAEPMRSLEEMVRVLAAGGRLAIMAVFDDEGEPGLRKGVVVFGRDELSDALSERGLIGVEQHVLRRAQYIGAQKPKV